MWLNINGNWIGRHSGKSWQTYWTTHLFGEDKLNFRTKSRNDLSLIDDFGNNASILTPTFKSTTSSEYLIGDKTRISERLWDGNSWTIYMKFMPVSGTGNLGSLIEQGNAGGNTRGLGCYCSNDVIYIYYGDGNSHTGWGQFVSVYRTSNYLSKWVELFLTFDFSTKQLTAELYDADSLALIDTIGGRDLSAFTFGVTDNAVSLKFSNHHVTICDYRKFSNVKTISQARNLTYNTDIIADYADMISGSDISGNGNHLTRVLMTKANKYYTSSQRHLLDNGYSKYIKLDSEDLYVPYTRDGVIIENNLLATTVGEDSGYVFLKEFAGNEQNHNLADSIINIPGDNWDRSDTSIWSDLARAETTYYDSLNPNYWHISELNQLKLITWANIDYKGICFIKATPNSVDIEERDILQEIFDYTINNTNDDLNNILRYTNDYTILQSPYLFDPYNEVLKVTALEDSVFKFNINNSIFYDLSDVWANIATVQKLNSAEDDLTTIFRWMRSQFSSGGSNFYGGSVITGQRELLPYLNSHSSGLCSDIAQAAYNILNHYYPDESFVFEGTSHTNNQQLNSFLEMYFQFAIYKDIYAHASFSEIIADTKLFLEPIRKTANSSYINSYTQANLDLFEAMVRDTDRELSSLVDNLTMQLPSTASFVFPVKGVLPTGSMALDQYIHANAVVTIPISKIGIVKMPFILIQVTGQGSVKYAGVTYNLPTDESALTAILQWTAPDPVNYGTFEILTNTGGVEADYIINAHRLLLTHKNDIIKGIITGDISVEAVATDIPVETGVVRIDKKLADQYTLHYNKWHTRNKSMRFPWKGDLITKSWVNFEKVGNSKPWAKDFTIMKNNTGVADIIADSPVVDTCWAAKLMPRDDSFSDSLELSFTAIDDSNIYYTTDESTPDATKTQYTEPFTISATTTVKWINIKEGYADSHVNTRVITKS